MSEIATAGERCAQYRVSGYMVTAYLLVIVYHLPQKAGLVDWIKVLMMMMKAPILMWAGIAEKSEQPKMALKSSKSTKLFCWWW